MPINLYKFLNTSSQLRDFNLLPIDIPNPIDLVEYEPVEFKQIRKGRDVDTFYIRSNTVTWIEILIYFCLFSIVFSVVSKIERKSSFVKFLKHKYIKMFRANVMILVLSVLADFGFSASATLQNKLLSRDAETS